MRVVMVTDDVRIDRRILQEAESLTRIGMEVIIVGRLLPDEVEFERYGKVKIERVDHHDHTVTEETLLSRDPHEAILPLYSEHILATASGLPSPIEVAADEDGPAGERMRIYRMLRDFERGILARVQLYNPDILHVHDLPSLNVGVVGKRLLNVPLIYDAHEAYPEIFTLTAEQRDMLVDLERTRLPYCDAVITVNPSHATYMSRFYGIPRPYCIMNAIDCPEELRSGGKLDRFRETLPIPDDHKILLYQGWICNHRGLSEVVRAMAQVPENIHLVLLGYGSFASELVNIAASLGIGHRVHHHPTVAQDVLLQYDLSADAGIIPYTPLDVNSYICSPNKLFEFIQTGLPIVCNDQPFLKSVVDTNGFGIVQRFDTVGDRAEAIRRMFDPSLGGPERFSPNLSAYSEFYSWKMEEQKLFKIYDDILRGCVDTGPRGGARFIATG